MLIQSFLPSSVEFALSFVSDHGKEDFLCDWMPATETWQMCPKCDEDFQGCSREAVSIRKDKKNANDLSSLNPSITCSQLSTVSTTLECSALNNVYKRRKLQKDSVAMFTIQASANTNVTGGCNSAVSSETPSITVEKEHVGAQLDHETEVVIAPAMCNRELLAFKSESINGCSVGEEHGCVEASDNSIHKIIELSTINDSCSSSKSNMEFGSVPLKTETDDTGECSSSDALDMEVMRGHLSRQDLCIAILSSQHLLEGNWPVRTGASAGNEEIRSASSCSLSCKVCGHSETTLNMLICDHCDEVFHMSCCNPRIKKIPIDEWFCHLCLKKTRKMTKETTTRKSLNINSETGCRLRNTIATSKSELSPIASMLRDTEPYATGVRIGKGFQAEVPDWSGPIINDVEIIPEPLEVDPAQCVSLHEWKSNRHSWLSSIGNWLQCQEVIVGMGEGVDGTICGKWRRAPLFEVQTDNWDCFRSVHWDPIHSDCAVPQELETDQVLKQLKYIQMLRPRLLAKRSKSSVAGSSDSTEDVKNIRTL